MIQSSVLNCITQEFKKSKRKSPLLLICVVIAINVGYLFVGVKKNDLQEMKQAWESIFFYLPILNTIFLSVLMAILASRSMDIEHKSNTWNIIQTLQSKKDIFLAKIVWGIIWLIIFDILEIGSSIALAKIMGVKSYPSARVIIITALATFLAGLIIYQIQLILSLLFQNQFAALSINLFGTLVGLFGSYISSNLLLPWSLFGTLRSLNMDYEKGYEVALYSPYTVPVYIWLVTVAYLVITLAIGIILYTTLEEGRISFIKARVIKSASIHTSLPIEMIKLKRSPVWIAFIILPAISCVIGIFNFVNNQEILSFNWEDLWTQQSLFLGLFFLPPLIGIFSSLLWRMEHVGTNWNIILTLESPIKIVGRKIITCAVISSICIIWISVLYITSGKIIGIKDSIPYDVVECLICGIFGCIAISAAQIFLSLVIRSFAVPVGMALAGGLAGIMLIVQGWGFALPYSMLQMGLKSTNLTEELDIFKFIIFSIGYLVLFYVLSVMYLKKSDRG